ncbi:efflux RND transporter permease subunit [Leucobacter chromiiresistens]|uniref:Hydrophobic/amphiphilic exporter-1, HAE1 family n=2 Tax=Leucobacter chromiiresistens TaxID=1079994 RepID=A0A1H1BAE4_9MICO|nr:efflux RND transporter permease subunit [Leucobacter chromiiresistens]SDQ48872.1 hydrophobic/amphiphilic exporter-1, HAE1 family [Leucobacter chromiiresistens]
MHLLTALSLKNRALIALVTIVAAVFGVIGVGSLKQELMPSVQFPTIAVVTSYPGASPEVVNNDVSTPIETALRGVPQLESSSATSSTGTSTVLAEFTYGVDLAATEQKVERAISRISQTLPEAADTQVLSGTIDDFPVIQIAVTPAEGEDLQSTADLVERVAVPELSDIDGVRDAQLSGARPERITIQPNLDALAERGLSPQTITDTLQQSGVLIAAGSITEGDRTLAVQAGTELQSAEEIAALPIALSAEQLAPPQEQPEIPGQFEIEPPEPAAPATIGEVAEVRLEPGPEQSISRVDGAPALTIGVTKTSAANTVDVSHAVQDQLDELQDQLGGAQLTVIFDQAPYVEQSIETLTTEGLLGLVFAVLVILVFLMSIRATLVTAISIPTSVLLAFVGLNFADYTLNLLTLGALTISIGRVVDDSIVVIENIKRHLADGGDRAAVIIRAVREVAGAITASTVTTVAVFLPMAFVAGMVGELFRPFAFTVTIALVASLLVSLTIVPVLAYWFLRTGPSRRRRGFVTAGSGTEGEAAEASSRSSAEEIDEHPTALQRGYRPVIEWTLRRPAITLLIAVVVFSGTVAASPLMKTSFLGSDEQNSVGLVQSLAPGTSLDAQLAQAESVEQALNDVPAIESVQVTIGSAGGAAALFGGGGDGTVNYSITTDPDADQAQAQDDIRDAVDQLEGAGEFSIGQSGGGVTSSSAIEVDVTAPDQETLAQASDAVVAALQDEPSLQQVESDLGQSREFLRIAVDRGRAAELGLSEAGVAGQVTQQMQPAQIGQISMDATTVSVYLANATAPTDQAGVAALPIQTATGSQPLSSLAAVEVADGPVTVRTADGVRSVTVSALPKGDDLGTASAEVTAALESLELPDGASASVGGVLSQQADAFQQLGIALLAAILIVYVVMVATFRSLLQPLLLLISVPFAATGAILLLIVTGIPLGVASLIGVLMLIGIVVTNAIVLIDLVNQYRMRGDALRDAVLHGSLQRLRPIVMTALATILALTPMALGITGKGGFISQPLAVVVIGGLLSSTVLTLVVLPTLYYLVERRREGGPKRGGPVRRRRSPRPDAGPALAGAGAGAVTGAGLGAGTGAASGSGAAAGAVSAAGAGSVFGVRRRRGAGAAGDARAHAETDVDSVGAAHATHAADPAEPPTPAAPVPAVPAPAAPAPPVPSASAVPPVPAVPVVLPAPQEPVAPAQQPRAEPEAPRGAAAAEEAIESPVLRESTPAHGIPEQVEQPRVAHAPAEQAVAESPVDEPVAGEPEQLDAAEADPVTIEPAAVNEPMGPATEQMSLALDELGFTGDDNPLADLGFDEPAEGAAPAHDPSPEPASQERRGADHAVSPLFADGPVAAGDASIDPASTDPASNDPASTGHDPRVPESAAPGETESIPAPVSAPVSASAPTASAAPEPEPAPEPAADAEPDAGPQPGPASAPAHAPTPDPASDPEAEPERAEPAPPITGELDWEQLMWQATQEVDEAENAASPKTDPGAGDAPDATPGTLPGNAR